MDFSFSYELLLFIALGFFAQLVDGALGMAYGLIATTALLSLGTAPALASASVHTAEVVTTGLAGASHAWHRISTGRCFATGARRRRGRHCRRLYPDRVAGILAQGVRDLLSHRHDGDDHPPRSCQHRSEEGTTAQRERKLPAAAVGGAGGFLDAVGGGGWGPIVTSTLLSRGDHPRHAIGTVSLSEFFLTVAISVTFLLNLELSKYIQPVLGLVIGGAAAAPLAGYLSRVLPPRILIIAVAVVVGTLSVVNIGRLAWPFLKGLSG